MTKAETIQLIAMIKTAYPKYFISNNKDEVVLQVNVWHEMFIEDPYEIVVQAIKSLICSLKFPPTIADVREKINFIMQPEELSEMEAWGKVLRAIQNSAYFSSEEFNKLPDIIQRVVGTPNQLVIWGQMDIETVNSVIQSNFMRSYKATYTRNKTFNELPQSTKDLVKRLQENREKGIQRITTVDNLQLKDGRAC